VEKYCRAGQTTDDSMVRAHCMLGTEGYRHPPRILNIYCFPLQTVVARASMLCFTYIACLVRFREINKRYYLPLFLLLLLLKSGFSLQEDCVFEGSILKFKMVLSQL